MAIEVLVRGIKPEEVTYDVTCFGCRSQLRFTGADGKTSHDQRDGSYISITCPVCSKPISTQVKQPSVAEAERARRAHGDGGCIGYFDR